MPKECSPAFQFYPKDFLTSSAQASMSCREAGAYIRLLCHCWLEGSIPDDDVACARLAGATVKEMRRMWPVVAARFYPDNGVLRQHRLDREREKQGTFKAEQSERGRRRSDTAARDANGLFVPAGDRQVPDLFPVGDQSTAIESPRSIPAQDSVNRVLLGNTHRPSSQSGDRHPAGLVNGHQPESSSSSPISILQSPKEKKEQRPRVGGPTLDHVQQVLDDAKENLAHIKATAAETRATLAAFRAGFEDFWGRYPNHAGKKPASRAWDKLHPSGTLQEIIIKALDEQKLWPGWQKDGGQFVPHASTWLNQERWNDEAPTNGAGPSKRTADVPTYQELQAEAWKRQQS